MKRMMSWEIGIVIIVYAVYTFSIARGSSHMHAVFATGFALVAVVGGAIAGMASVKRDENNNLVIDKETWPKVWALAAAAFTAAVAFSLEIPSASTGAIVPALVFGSLAIMMTRDIMRGVGESSIMRNWRFWVAVGSLALELGLVMYILEFRFY